jgi:pimeloyl-ACP methyl ester carboxylesterase
MLNDSWASLVFIRVCIFGLQAIGPGSLAWTSWLACDLLASRKTITDLSLPGLQAWIAAEALFYLFFLWYRRHLQRETVHPPLRSRKDRKQLVEQVRTEIHDIDKFLSGWFRGANPKDIGREGLKSFLDWTFWEGRVTEDDAEELEEYVRVVEKMAGHTFPEGQGRAKALRLTLDPIEMDVRCLTWYATVMLVEQITFARFWIAGFSYRKTSVAVFPPRPLALLAGGKSPAKTLSYWYRPHTSKTRLPVLFIHGIGIGLYPYVDTLEAISKQSEVRADDKADGSVGVLAIELLPICSRLTQPILQREEFIKQITAILDAHGYDKFVLASHSYGSVFSTYMLTHDALTSRISATVLIDPVTILLHMPDVAFNFTVRAPKTANEWQLWYFASKDPGTSHTLGRHFFWNENCLWKSRIKKLLDSGMRFTISLASRDLIVDTSAVAQYLLHDDVPDPVVTANGQPHMKLETHEKGAKDDAWETKPWGGRGLDVLWCEDLDHAQVFDDRKARARLLRVIAEYTKRDEKDQIRV